MARPWEDGVRHEEVDVDKTKDEGSSRQSVAIPDITMGCRPDGQCESISQEGLDFTGADLAQLLGFAWLEYVHFEDRAPLVADWNASLRAGRYFPTEIRVRRHDGKHLRFNLRITPLRGADGQAAQWVVLLSGLQTPPEIGAVLRRQEEDLRLAAECSADVMFVWAAGESVRWFGKLEGLPGFSADEFPRTLEDWESRLHAEDLDEVKERIARSIREDVPCDVEYRIRRSSGGFSHWWARGRAVRDHMGIATRWVGAVTDITERKRAEEAQRESYQLLRSIIDSSSDLIFVKDQDLRTVLCNQTLANVLGKPAEEMRGKTDIENGWPEELVYGNAEKGVRGFAADDRAALSGESVHEPVELCHVQGELRAFDTVKGPLRNSRGEIAGMFGISRDITESMRIHEALKASEARYRSLFAANPEPICVYDVETHMILEVNDAAVEHYGFPREKLLSMAVSDLVAPEDLERWLAHVSQPRGEFSNSGPWLLRTAQGNVIEVKTYSHALTFQGRAARLVQAHDVTEERRVQRALLESEERFRRAVTQSPFPIMIHAEGGAVLQLSQSWCEVTGYLPEDLTTVGAWAERAYGQRRPQAEADFETLYGLDHRAGQGDCEIRTRSGAKRIWEFSSAPLGRLADGRRSVISMAMDVTERRAAEQELRGLNRLLELLSVEVHRLSEARDLETVLSVVCSAARRLCGAEGAMVALREQEEAYYAEEDGVCPRLKGRRVRLEESLVGWAMEHGSSTVNEDIRTDEKLAKANHDLGAVGCMATVPIRASAPMGAIACFWSQRHVPKADERRLVEALAEAAGVAIANVRLYEEMERRVEERTAQLLATNQELDAFAHSVSHDLRAPLRAMSGFSDALLAMFGDQLDAKGRHYLDRIQNAAFRMDQLIGDLLNLSRVARRQLSFQQVDLTALAEEIVAELRSQAPDRQVEVLIQGNLSATGDSRLLRVALENLLSNAWKFTGRCAMARIEVGETGSTGETGYFVRDNGAGFDMAYSEKLFAPFQRLHSVQEFPGTGIGLATVQRIVRRHGGRIWVEAAPDQGATVYFTLGRPA